MRTKINYEALGDTIVVDPKYVEITKTGIELLDQTVKDTQVDFPEVVSVGDEVKNINVGDFVALSGTAKPALLTIDGIKYLQFRKFEVLGKILVKPINLEK